MSVDISNRPTDLYIYHVLHRPRGEKKRRRQEEQGEEGMVETIAPTLNKEVYGVLRDLMEYARLPQTRGLIIGGANGKAEAEKLTKGARVVNILVCTCAPPRGCSTPPRSSPIPRASTFIDEADRILEIGFEEDRHHIIKIRCCPRRGRRTVLLALRRDADPQGGGPRAAVHPGRHPPVSRSYFDQQ
jgi:superfamily II DNA/RNA helicase